MRFIHGPGRTPPLPAWRFDGETNVGVLAMLVRVAIERALEHKDVADGDVVALSHPELREALREVLLENGITKLDFGDRLVS